MFKLLCVLICVTAVIATVYNGKTWVQTNVQAPIDNALKMRK